MYDVFIPHGYNLADMGKKGEVRARNIHNNKSERGIRNIEERNVGTKRKIPKQDQLALHKWQVITINILQIL